MAYHEDVGRKEMNRRKWVRRTLVQKQAGLCAICSGTMNLREGDADSVTIDHIRPVSKGGTDQITNLQLTHKRCNEAKANEWPTQTEDR